MDKLIPDAESGPRVRSALNNALAAKPIGSSKALTDLLTFLVEEELAGRGDRLTPYSVAVDAMKLPETFDPSLDSRLRVEMKRLREALDFYYSTDGRDDDVKIVIPARSYRPELYEIKPKSRTYDIRRLKNVGLVLASSLSLAVLIASGTLSGGIFSSRVNAIEPQRAVSERPDLIQVFIDPAPENDVAHSLTGDFADAIGGFARSNVRLRSRLEDNVRSAFPEDYRFTIEPERTATLENPGRRVTVKVIHLSSGDFIAAPSIPVPLLFGNSNDRREAILDVAASLMQVRGSVQADYSRRGDLTPTMRCLEKRDWYQANQTDEAHLEAITCIEDLLASGVENAELHTALAGLFREEGTDQRNQRPGDPFARALQAINRAIELDPQLAEAHIIAATIHAMRGNREALTRSGEIAIRRNPFNSRVVGVVGFMLVTVGETEVGLEYLERSRNLSSTPRAWRNYAFFLAHVANGDIDRATSHGLLLAQSEDPLMLSAYVIASHLAGLHDQAHQALTRWNETADGRYNTFSEMFERRNYDADLTVRLVSLLDDLSAFHEQYDAARHQ